MRNVQIMITVSVQRFSISLAFGERPKRLVHHRNYTSSNIALAVGHAQTKHTHAHTKRTRLIEVQFKTYIVASLDAMRDATEEHRPSSPCNLHIVYRT